MLLLLLLLLLSLLLLLLVLSLLLLLVVLLLMLLLRLLLLLMLLLLLLMLLLLLFLESAQIIMWTGCGCDRGHFSFPPLRGARGPHASNCGGVMYRPMHASACLSRPLLQPSPYLSARLQERPRK